MGLDKFYRDLRRFEET